MLMLRGMNRIVNYAVYFSPLVPNFVDYIPSSTVLRLMHYVSEPVTFGIDICNNSSSSSRSSSVLERR
jgi:hypothetical protein